MLFILALDFHSIKLMQCRFRLENSCFWWSARSASNFLLASNILVVGEEGHRALRITLVQYLKQAEMRPKEK